jgi:uncharacterized membrane protein (DUF2068 family)
MTARPKNPYLGFKVIGVLKLTSGVLALGVGLGIMRLFGEDPGPRVERAISHLGLDPQNYAIHTLISWLTGIDRAHLRAVEAGTFFYAVLHATEGIGLLLQRDWAGYLVVVASSLLIPFEIYEIIQKPRALRIFILIVNAGIVIYLIAALRKEHAMRVGVRPDAREPHRE